MCRKPNISHEKKKKGGRLKNLAELQSSLDMYRDDANYRTTDSKAVANQSQMSSEATITFPNIPISIKPELKPDYNTYIPSGVNMVNQISVVNKTSPASNSVLSFNAVAMSPYFSPSNSSSMTPSSPAFEKYSESPSYISPFFEYASNLLRGMSPFRRPLARDTMHLPLVIGNNADHAPSKQGTISL